MFPDIREFGDDPKRDLFACTTDQDRGLPRRLGRAMQIGALDELAFDGHRFPAPQSLKKLDRLAEMAQSRTDRWKWHAEIGELALHPTGAET